MTKTYQQQLQEALACTTQAEAEWWLEREAAQLMAEYPRQFAGPEQAKRVIRANLGYMTGYYGLDVAEVIYELFDAEHPVFGTPAMRATLTPEDAFAAGLRWGQSMRAQDDEC